MNEVVKAIKNRRSVRKYKPEQINEDILNTIIEAGIFAPSAHNQQPWHFTVIQNKELLQDINLKTRESMLESEVDWIQKMASKTDFKVTYGAPTLIVVSGRKDALAWPADCAAAIQNMLIAAESLNIGSVWLGLLRFYFAREEVKALKIPEGYEPYYGAVFGYKVLEHQQAPKRKMNVVHYIK
ncbi:nitroreductase [Syntrophobotulus glycolicus DSM 8271]|uniref:Nitroreductase n=1 Tax=Syntrophobotulus glycolicus (strain DSM 8271 / FlGlyR) TaxID=645991 RepID=F0SZL7_SYNGF|nr:nitroreductase family protein [Syntrophobotulus glycolicus]ADY56103.1 nitroreductase [Syntrophobotulus glycolicus DSM 8271]